MKNVWFTYGLRMSKDGKNIFSYHANSKNDLIIGGFE